MRLTIVGTLSSDECVVDADTGLADTKDRQASQPIRLLAKCEPEPSADDVDVRLLKNALTYRGPSRMTYLAANLETTPEDAASIVERGDDHVVDYYIAKKLTSMKTAWEARRRQESFGLWCFRNKIVKVEGWSIADREEIALRVKHVVFSEEQELETLKREVEVFENVEKMDWRAREPIPQQVQMFVWQRDQGRCVKCGSQERLEYDHIIPLAKGGSNTERNIQLLCESCNRAKGSTIS